MDNTKEHNLDAPTSRVTVEPNYAGMLQLLLLPQLALKKLAITIQLPLLTLSARTSYPELLEPLFQDVLPLVLVALIIQEPALSLLVTMMFALNSLPLMVLANPP